MATSLYFATSNNNKLKEAQALLPTYAIHQKDITLHEIQGDLQDIAMHKAQTAFAHIGAPCFVDDTALCFTALEGLPGPYIRFFLEKLTVNKLGKLLDPFEDKSAQAICAIGYCDGNITKVFIGVTTGTIIEPRGAASFGWDPIFLPNGYTQTYAQMSTIEKNNISHRYKAFAYFKQYMNTHHP